jgi:hypothetical protein
MNIRAALTDPPKPLHPAFRYGMLILCLLLLIGNLLLLSRTTDNNPYHRYGNLVITLMLLINLLAFQFHWPTTITMALRVLAWAGTIFACLYTFNRFVPFFS